MWNISQNQLESAIGEYLGNLSPVVEELTPQLLLAMVSGETIKRLSKGLEGKGPNEQSAYLLAEFEKSHDQISGEVATILFPDDGSIITSTDYKVISDS